MSKEKAVRDAATALHKAISDAEADGLRVEWPRRAADLPRIAISEKAKPKADIVAEADKAGLATIRNPNPSGAKKDADAKKD